jgi:hypothetical protein
VCSAQLTLTVWNKHGEKHQLAVPGPGGVARVCVGERDGAHGSVWRIWANPSASDVYIACRDIAKVQKWSLHESGDWRHQWETRQYAMHVTRREDRLIDQWRPPPEFEDIGWRKAFFIQARLQDLVDYGDGSELPENIIWMPPPPQGGKAVVHVLIARPDRLNSEVKGVFPFYAFSLANGTVVLVTYSVQPVLAEEEAELQSMLEQVTSHSRSGEHIAKLSAPRITATVVDEEAGDRGVFDIAIPRLPAERMKRPRPSRRSSRGR